MYRHSLSPLLPLDSSRTYRHIEGGDFNNDNSGEDNRPRFSIPRKPVLGTNVAVAKPAHLKMHKMETTALEDTFRHSSPSESSSPSVLRDWWLEILCCFLVIGASLAIVATVYPYRDRPLPQWPYSLSINSLISIYVVILKAAMLLVLAQGLGHLKWSWFKHPRPLADLGTYDDASRGSLGAVSLLWTLRGRSVVSSIGALVTVSALAIDPFAQQIVRYYPCIGVVSGSEATIARTNWYATNGGSHNGADLETIGGPMQSAINTGIFNPGTFVIPFSCPTGNCTFPSQYHSVGYCSSCIDISAKVNVTQLSTTDFSFILPSGLSAGREFVLTMRAANNESVDNQDYQILMGLSNHASDEFSSGTCPASHAWACRGYGAAQCSLFPCIRTFTGTVNAGNLTEKSESSSTNWGAETELGDQSAVDMTCLNETEKLSLRKIGYQFDNETKWLAFNVSLNQYNETFQQLRYDMSLAQYTATVATLPAKCVYTISGLASLSLNSFFNGFFSGQLAVGAEALQGSSMLQKIWDLGDVNFDSVQVTFSNVADSMTSSIRQNGENALAGYQTGQVNHDETCVRPRWGWMAFPAALSALTIAFFVAMVAQTRASNAESLHDYKSDILPLMYHGLEQSTQDLRGKEINRTAEMSRDAKQLYVRLSATDRGWRFVEVAANPGI